LRANKMNPQKIFLFLFLLSAAFNSGCVVNKSCTTEDYFYLNPEKNLSCIGRVALIELNNDTSYPQVSRDTTDALYQAIQKKQLFGISLVRLNDPAYEALQLNINCSMNLEEMLVTKKTLNCDAILVGTVTQYQPYPSLIIGLRLKMIDLGDGQLDWGLEQIWDGSDKITQEQIKSYFRSQGKSNSKQLGEKLVSVSPLEFMKFVSYETAETMKTGKK
jgi:hypothetical protein